MVRECLHLGAHWAGMRGMRRLRFQVGCRGLPRILLDFADLAGEFRFTARKPAAIPGPGESMQAPHLCVSLFARGLLHPNGEWRLASPEEMAERWDLHRPR
jgi:hypothetical protein